MTAIFALVTDAFGGRGGIAQYNRDFLNVVADHRDVSSIIVLPRYAPDEVHLPSTLKQKPPQSGRFFYAVTALIIALGQRVDIVFCGHLYMAPLAWLVSRLKRAKLVIQIHGIEAWERPSRLRCAALDAADIVLSVSRYTRARVSSWAMLAPERIVVVPNTVGRQFSPGDGSRLRAEMGFEGKEILLTVGRLDGRERYKGHDRVIEIIPELVANGHDILYAVVGMGDDQQRLEELARAAGVAERVCFLGSVEEASLVQVYRMADLFVMPSTGEGFGIVFLEAMASGIRAVGFSVGGASDALADGELGTAAAGKDLAAAITSQLTVVKTDPYQLSANVRSRFGLEIFRARVHLALERVWRNHESQTL